MAGGRIYLLNEADRRAIAETVGAEMRRFQTTLNRPAVPSELGATPEVYVARPLRDIQGMADTRIFSSLSDVYRILFEHEGTGTGTGTGYDGTAYGFDGYGDLILVDHLHVKVYNLSFDDIAVGSWVLAIRDKWGNWIVGSATTGTATTTTTTLPPCSGDCTWTWDNALGTGSSSYINHWALTSDDCGDGCNCRYPDFCGYQEGDTTKTSCTRDETPKPTVRCTTTTTSTSTTTVTPCPDCDGGCLWDYSWAGQFWDKTLDTCSDVCPCSQPTTDPCASPAATPCVYPPDPDPCSGNCRWLWDVDNLLWQRDFSASSCYGGSTDCGCTCVPPTLAGSACGDIQTTPCFCANPEPPNPCTTTTSTTTTTTTKPSCGGFCFWRCSGGSWPALPEVVNNCFAPQGCSCPQPGGTCTGNELRQTQCNGTTTTTTTTTSTSTTSTTTSPGCGTCTWFEFDNGVLQLLADDCTGSCVCAQPLESQPLATRQTNCVPSPGSTTTTTPAPGCALTFNCAYAVDGIPGSIELVISGLSGVFSGDDISYFNGTWTTDYYGSCIYLPIDVGGGFQILITWAVDHYVIQLVGSTTVSYWFSDSSDGSTLQTVLGLTLDTNNSDWGSGGTVTVECTS